MGVGSQRHTPTAFNPRPRERPGTHCTGGWVGPRAGLDRCRKSRPYRDRSPDLPACSESLYRLHYPGSTDIWVMWIRFTEFLLPVSSTYCCLLCVDWGHILHINIVCVCVCACSRACVLACMCTCARAHTHTHTHTHTLSVWYFVHFGTSDIYEFNHHCLSGGLVWYAHALKWIWKEYWCFCAYNISQSHTTTRNLGYDGPRMVSP